MSAVNVNDVAVSYYTKESIFFQNFQIEEKNIGNSCDI